MKALTIIGSITLVTTAVSALGGTTSSSGVPTPAAFSCINAGGKVASYLEQGSQGLICRVDGATVELWTLFHEVKSGTETQAISAYFNDRSSVPQIMHPASGKVGFPNPASVYCESVAGTTVIVSDTNSGREFGLCRFADNSAIDVWTLFRGPDASGNEALTQLLSNVE